MIASYRDDLTRRDHVHVVNDFYKTSWSKSADTDIVQAILSSYVPHDRFRVTYDPSGKPRVSSDDGFVLYLGFSHVDDLLLIALSTHADLGVDVEAIRPRGYTARIAKRYFDSEPKNLDEFYRAWTAREAFIKAIGSRISQSLAAICSRVEDDHVLLGLTTTYTHRADFFTPRENYCAALCRTRNAPPYVVIMNQSR